VQSLPWNALQPYVTVVVLECTADDPVLALMTLEKFLAEPGRQQPGKMTEVISAGASDEAGGLAALGDLGVDQIAGFVRRHQQSPPWVRADAGYVDIVHDLTLVLRRGMLVAVHAAGDIGDRLQRWLDKEHLRPFRRLPAEVLESALLQGEAKGLWLRGTHRRNARRADTKNLGGLNLREALNPVEDSSYAMGSAKAELESDPNRLILRGAVGTTPRRSSVWFKASVDLRSFATAVVELLALLETTKPTAADTTLPFLARSVSDLSTVWGAYDISTDDPGLMLSGDADVVYAADVLQDAYLGIQGSPSGPDFKLEVGFGSVSGTLAVTAAAVGGRCDLQMGFAGEPTDPGPVREILDAMEYRELLSIYYRSGHTWTDGQMYTAKLPRGVFPNWTFEDLSSCVITQEKPLLETPQEIHDKIGQPDDTSIFGWVSRYYTDGWLICDDGPGEIADFLHVSGAGVLSLIHVKGAASVSPKRRVAASAYEVVVSQAVKNLSFIDSDLLRKSLASPVVKKPACWNLGVPGDDRSEFLDALDLRDASSSTQIVIVQPHVSKPILSRLRDEAANGTTSDDLLRLHRLEGMLLSARATAVGMNADLEVIGALV
jgi:hypothetical protein